MKQLTELLHIYDINKKGDDFLTDLLTKKVVINIKIDQSAFVVENANGNLKFYGREGKQTINKIKRIGMDLYERPIRHIESTNWERLPRNFKVYLEFFDDRLPTLVKYKYKPKNDLIISYVKDSSGKILKPDDRRVVQIAKTLEVSPPPILFSGKLSKIQQERVKEFVSLTPEDRQIKFSESNFLKYILNIFTPKDATFLEADGFEGLVFYFDGEPNMAKLVDPNFTADIIDKKKKSDNEENLHSFLSGFIYDNFDRYADKHLRRNDDGDSDSAYVKIITGVTKDLADLAVSRGIDFSRFESENENRFSRLTFDFVPPEIISLINRYWWVEDLFRILLFGFRKEKKRANPKSGITKEVMAKINLFVSKIKDQGIQLEEGFITEEIVGKQSREIDLFLGRMQPIHNGHLKIIQKMRPGSIVVLVKGSKSSADKTKNPLDAEYQEYLIKKIDPRINVIVSPNGFIPGILQNIRRMGFEVTRILCGADRINGYRTQIERINKVANDKTRYDVKFVETERVTSATKVRQSIRNDDYEMFTRLVPRAIHSEYSKLREKLMNVREQLTYNNMIQSKKVLVEELALEKELIEKIKTSQDPDVKDKEGTQPKRYYAKDAEGKEMSKSTKEKRAAHFKKGAKKDDNDPTAYKPAPGDKSAETKPSKWTKKYKEMYEEMEGLKKKAEKSGYSYGTLKKVYDRGVAAWRTGHRPGTTPQQWGYARVNAFIAKQKSGKKLNHDTDLA